MDYFAEFDSKKQCFIFKDKNENDVSSFYKDAIVAYCDAEHNSIQYNMPRILFKNDDYEKYANPPHKNLKNEIEYLNSIKEEKNLTLVHELKHIKNNLLVTHRMLRDDYHALSAENMYKQRIEDERTASIAELIYAINKYQKCGNYKDFSAFMGYFDWIANDINGKNEKEIQSYFKDIPAIVNKHLHYWTKSVLKDYSESAIEDATYYAKLNSLALDDVDDKEYDMQRSLMYTFNIYNPETKKEEIVNLAKYVDVDIPISESVQKGYIEPFMDVRKNVQNEYQKNNHKIKFSLVKYYKKMCLKNIKKISQSLLEINRNNTPTSLQEDKNLQKFVCNKEKGRPVAEDLREAPSLLDLKLLQNKFNRR